MTLKQYLESSEGKSILSTANADGMVTSAIYSRPHVFDDGTIAFVGKVEDAPKVDGLHLNLRGRILAPGFIDVHVHGGNGIAFGEDDFGRVGMFDDPGSKRFEDFIAVCRAQIHIGG